MAGYKFFVLTNPVAGREDEYNDWYSNRHLADIVAIPGFSAAQRFVQRKAMMGDIPQKYLAIYELDVTDLPAALAAVETISQTEMEISDGLDIESVAAGLFEPCGELHADDGAQPGPFRTIALTDAAQGRDAEFNDWYTNVHIREVMEAGGHGSAERFRRRSPAPSLDEEYLTLYSLEGKDWPAVEQAMQNSASVKFTLSDAGKPDVRLALYEACCPRVTA